MMECLRRRYFAVVLRQFGMRCHGRGPSANHTGVYRLEGEYPVVHVECVTADKNRSILTRWWARPQEISIGYAVAARVLARDEDAVSEIVDVTMPLPEGIFPQT